MGHKEFHFGKWNGGNLGKNGCGTLGCAIGECPILFPRHWHFDAECGYWPKLKSGPTTSSDGAADYFNLSRPEVFHLFVPVMQRPDEFGGQYLDRDATRHQVARNIYAFLKKKGF